MTTIAASEGVVASQGTRTWWLARRSAGSIGAFRVLIGGALAFHFAQAFFHLSPWLIDGRLLPPGAVVGGLKHSVLDQGLGLHEPRATFAIGALLGCLVLMGFAPRVSAGLLYALSLVTFWTILPIATHDDYFAIIAAFVLMLLPLERATLSLRTRSGRRKGDAGDVRAPAIAMILVCVVALYLLGVMGAWNHLDGTECRNIDMAYRGVAILLVTPLFPVQALGVLLQVALHVFLASRGHMVVTNVLLAATAIFFWGERAHDAREKDRWVMDAPIVLWTVACAITVAGLAASEASSGPAGQARQLAMDAGLLPVHLTLPQAEGNSALVRVRGENGEVRAIDPRGNDPWSRSLVERLGSSDGAVSRNLAAVMARRQCHSGEPSGARGSIWSGQSSKQRLLEFECSSTGEPVGVR